jgi:hypothetical protein
MDFDAASAILLAFELTDRMTAVHIHHRHVRLDRHPLRLVITRVMVDRSTSKD